MFAAIRHKSLPVSVGYATVCKHSLGRVEDFVPHCDSGVLEAGMPVHSVELYSSGQTAFEQVKQWVVLSKKATGAMA